MLFLNFPVGYEFQTLDLQYGLLINTVFTWPFVYDTQFQKKKKNVLKNL